MSALITVLEHESGLQGYLAIDSTVNGRSYGGMRMMSDLSLSGLAEAAQVMTLKHGFLGLPLGGAKAGIVSNPDVPHDDKRRLLKCFGEALMPFLKTRSYVPGGDIGITDDDIRFMLTANGLSVQPRSLTGRSGLYTARTVFTAAITAAQHIGLDLNRSSVAIEGLGKVGSALAQAFWESGLKVVAISTIDGAIYNEKGLDIGELLKLYHEVGSRVVKLFPNGEQININKLAELNVDIFSPCAAPSSMRLDNANHVAARIISPGANVPTTPEAEEILFHRGILSIPDFVANCGGALGVSMEVAGLKEAFVKHFIDQRFGQKVAEMLKAVETKGIIPRDYAVKIAKERFLTVKEKAERKNITNGVFRFGLELYRRRLIPSYLTRLVTPVYFEHALFGHS